MNKLFTIIHITLFALLTGCSGILGNRGPVAGNHSRIVDDPLTTNYTAEERNGNRLDSGQSIGMTGPDKVDKFKICMAYEVPTRGSMPGYEKCTCLFVTAAHGGDPVSKCLNQISGVGAYFPPSAVLGTAYDPGMTANQFAYNTQQTSNSTDQAALDATMVQTEKNRHDLQSLYDMVQQRAAQGTATAPIDKK